MTARRLLSAARENDGAVRVGAAHAVGARARAVAAHARLVLPVLRLRRRRPHVLELLDLRRYTYETPCAKGTPARGPCARTGTYHPRRRGTRKRRSGRASSCTRAATTAPAAAAARPRRARRSSGPGRRGTRRRRCTCASCTCGRSLPQYVVSMIDAGPALPLLLEGLGPGVARFRVGLGEREGREVIWERRERVLFVGRGRLQPPRVGAARIRPRRVGLGLLDRFRRLRCLRWCGAVGVGSWVVPHTRPAYCQFAQVKGRPSFYALGACRDAAIFREQTIVGTKTASAGLELHSCRNA